MLAKPLLIAASALAMAASVSAERPPQVPYQVPPQRKANGRHSGAFPWLRPFAHLPADLAGILADGQRHHHASSAPAASDGSGSNASQPHPTLNFGLDRPAPVLLPADSRRLKCTYDLVQRAFANSYGKPSVTTFSPSRFEDKRCHDPSAWTGLTLTIHGDSIGRQFDRLGTVWFGNEEAGYGVEVWRHDNPEPTRNGIVWDTSKGIGRYYSLLKVGTDVVFDFPNIVDSTYTGILNVTLSITAYVDKSAHITPLAKRAPDAIYPISRQQKNDSSIFQLGGSSMPDGSVLLRLPQNAARAVVELYATGTGTEEFWYTGIPDRFYSSLPNATTSGYYGHGPYREVQLLIDGELAGLVAPYPVIYTGGISPLLWRPDASYGAFDSPAYHIDVTPFLGSLTDGQAHEFKVRVVSGEKDGAINDASWYVSGNVGLYLDESQERTTGSLDLAASTIASKFPDVLNTGKVTGNPLAEGKLDYTVKIRGTRKHEVKGTVLTGSDRKKGKKGRQVVWSQEIQYENRGEVTALSQTNVQRSMGSTTSSSDEDRSEAHDAWPSQAAIGQAHFQTRRHRHRRDAAAAAAQSHFSAPHHGHGPDYRAVKLSYSYPLNLIANVTNNSDGSASQFTELKAGFTRKVSVSPPLHGDTGSKAAKVLIGNEMTLARDDAAANWSFDTQRYDTVNVYQANANATPVYDYKSRQTLSYIDAAAATLDRTTATANGTVTEDSLHGSLAGRAQPPRLVVAS